MLAREVLRTLVWAHPEDGSDIEEGDVAAARVAVEQIRMQLAALNPPVVPLVGTVATTTAATTLRELAKAGPEDASDLEADNMEAARAEVQRIREQLATLRNSFAPPEGALANDVWSQPASADDIAAGDVDAARAAVSAIRAQLGAWNAWINGEKPGAAEVEAAATVVANEVWNKPIDATDLVEGDLEQARDEVRRIRESLTALDVALRTVANVVDTPPEPPPGGAAEIATIKDGLKKRGTAEVVEMMRALDRDGNGVLEREEFADGLLIAAYVIPTGTTAATEASYQMLFIAHKLFDIMDIDKGGAVDFVELAGGLTALSSTDPMVTCRVVFDLYDADGNDEISEEEMLSYMCNFMRMSATTGDIPDSTDIETTARGMVDRCFRIFDTDRSGVINFDEFMRWFTGQSAAPKVGGDPRTGPSPNEMGDVAVDVANAAATAAYNSAFDAMQSLTLVLVARDSVHADAEATLRRTSAIAVHEAATLKALVHTLQVATQGWRARERDLMDQVEGAQKEGEVLKARLHDRMHERTRSLRAHEIRAMDLRQKVALVEREIDRTPTSQVATHRILRQRVGTLKLELKETLEHKEEELLHHHDELDAARALVAEHITQADRARGEIALSEAGLPTEQRNAPSADPRRHELVQLEVQHLRTALRELAGVATEQTKLNSDAQRTVLVERRENQQLREQMGDRLTDFARKARELEVAEHALEDQIAALREHSALTGARVRADGMPVRDQGTISGMLRTMGRGGGYGGSRTESSLERTLRATGPSGSPHTTIAIMNPEAEIERLSSELNEVRAAKRELKMRQGEMMKTQFQGEVQRMLVQNLTSVLELEPQLQPQQQMQQQMQPRMPQRRPQQMQQQPMAPSASHRLSVQTIGHSKELLRQSYLESHTAPYFAHPQQQHQQQQQQQQQPVYSPTLYGGPAYAPQQPVQQHNPHLSQWAATNALRVQPSYGPPPQQQQMVPGPWYQTPMPLAQGSPMNWARGNRGGGGGGRF